ncbi:MAG: GCN5-related N-acetyltransferase [Polaromonas sp.]|nr:GCN5-related N-acetyltransferase [Polaromonas sp.]
MRFGAMRHRLYSGCSSSFSPTVPSSDVQFLTPTTPEQMQATRLVFKEYAAQLGIDLEFQDFSAELTDLPGDYAPPRGMLLLALVGGEIAGCCALRPLEAVDYPNACEMKRLYVRKAFRGFGIGRQLAQAVLDGAHIAGYRHVLLDTLSDMESARALYEDLGFEEIPPYYHNPIAGAHYLKADL